MDPLVAYCFTGALRSFAEPRVYGSIRENLIDKFSARRRLFFVVSFDCRLGTDTFEQQNASSAIALPGCQSDYTTREIDAALAYVGANSFEVVPNVPPPRVQCAAAPDVERHPSFWYQQSKTARCFAAVERHEAATGTCFDWVVRVRPDDVWKGPVPPAYSLQPNFVTTGSVWPFLTALQHWSRTNYSALDDHFLAAPRFLADAALGAAVGAWFDCRQTWQYACRCPPRMFLFESGFSKKLGRPTPILQSECLLGMHLRERGVRWRSDGRFSYMTRRVPDRHDKANKYTKMLATFAHQPGRWVETNGRTTGSDGGISMRLVIDTELGKKDRQVEHYERRARTVLKERWGEVGD